MVRTSGPSVYQDSDLKTYILLITVTAVEAQAVLSLFMKEIGLAFKRLFLGDKTYFDLGVLRGSRVIMVQSEMGYGRPGGALLVVDEAIRVTDAICGNHGLEPSERDTDLQGVWPYSLGTAVS